MLRVLAWNASPFAHRPLALLASVALVSTAGAQPTTRAVFCVNNVSDTVAAFRVAPDNTLLFVEAETTGDGPQSIAISPDGRHLAVGHGTASITDEELRIFQIAEDASLTQVAFVYVPDSPLDVAWLSNTTLAVTITRSSTNMITVYNVNMTSVPYVITPLQTEPAGLFVANLATSPDLQWLVNTNSSGNELRVFRNLGTSIVPVQTMPDASTFSVDVGFSVDGKYVYSAGGISNGRNKVLGYSIDANTGLLSPLEGSPFISSGNSPANIATAFAHGSHWLILGHGTDATVRTFLADAAGELTDTGFVFDVGLQGTIGDIATLGDLVMITDDSSAIDGITGIYCFRLNADGTFTEQGELLSTGGTRPEAIVTWQPPVLLLPGDMNCDGVVTNFDIDPFVLALVDPEAWMAAYPNCPILNGDVNGDGTFTNFDIDPFVELLVE
ncbi:MAG: hypothetical protein HRU75_02205 [Planctomycetia bacterium]|nr:MAG: hypothetical protein HRU75_02205 [Planctomycetia bacterium]